jgi:Flp pilus assembly pilin Flp
MNSSKVELTIILTLLAVSVFTLVNTITDWVPDVYGIAAMNLLILTHILWMRKYGNKA